MKDAHVGSSSREEKGMGSRSGRPTSRVDRPLLTLTLGGGEEHRYSYLSEHRLRPPTAPRPGPGVLKFRRYKVKSPPVTSHPPITDHPQACPLGPQVLPHSPALHGETGHRDHKNRQNHHPGRVCFRRVGLHSRGILKGDSQRWPRLRGRQGTGAEVTHHE